MFGERAEEVTGPHLRRAASHHALELEVALDALGGGHAQRVIEIHGHPVDVVGVGEERAPTANIDATGPGSWPVRCALLVAEVAEALAHAHSRGVLHRDVKPSNIMLHERGHAVLVDFGLGALQGAPP
jgi:serine/threonine protein kinase